MVSQSRARRLRVALRNARNAAGQRLDDVAGVLGWSKQRMSRIEIGEKVPDENEVALIMRALGASPTDTAELVELARAAHTDNWVVGLPGLGREFRTLLDFEDDATAETEVSLSTVPGLLQVSEYAQSLFAKAGVPTVEVGKLVQFRLLRQQLLHKDPSLRFHALIDESVLYRPFGTAAVMAKQLRHLLEVAELGTVTVQIIPYDAAYAPVDGTYRILEFDTLPPLAYVEYPSGGLFLEQDSLVSELRRVTALVAQAARDPAASVRMISEAMRKWEIT